MIKKLLKFSLFSIIILIIIVFYLSFFGINTTKFNTKIENEVFNINRAINLDLKSVKLLLNPFNFSINIKTYGPNIRLNNQQLELEYIKTNIPLKSTINKKFIVENLQVSTKKNKLNDVLLLLRSFNNSTELFILDKIIKDGFLAGDINLNFDNNGKIKDDYEIKGYIKKGKLNLLKSNIDNLNLNFTINKNNYLLEDIKTVFNKIQLSSSRIKISETNNVFLVDGELINDEKDLNLNLLKNLFGENIKKTNIDNIIFSSRNEFTFKVNKKLKIKDFKLTSKINLKKLNYKNNLLIFKKYLPNLKELVKLEDHKILITYYNNKIDITGNGKLFIEDKSEKLSYSIRKKNDQYIFKINININKNPLFVDELMYKKKENIESQFILDGVYQKNGQFKFNLISLKENNNNIVIKNLKIDNKFKVSDIESIELNYININNIKNEINLKKNNKTYDFFGKSFDATRLIDQALNVNNEDSPSIFSNLNTSINVKIKKTYLDDVSFVNNLFGNIDFKNNKIIRLNLKSIFPNNKKLNLTINTNNNYEKITTLYSGYPKPLVKRYKFIKGFDDGVLDFYSIKKNNISNSVLTIDNFKVKEVPVLAKLLTLASLQGIADLLTGEGIRFTDFEMKFSTEDKLMKIKEMYAIGPAISILMNGYIESKKLISLRGTMVPATTINRTIASIPLIGNILVGKKVGEGVFGVSFKIKGPPKELRTTVNPIKTLTPRFITRTLEKIKKN